MSKIDIRNFSTANSGYFLEIWFIIKDLHCECRFYKQSWPWYFVNLILPRMFNSTQVKRKLISCIIIFVYKLPNDIRLRSWKGNNKEIIAKAENLVGAQASIQSPLQNQILTIWVKTKRNIKICWCCPILPDAVSFWQIYLRRIVHQK